MYKKPTRKEIKNYYSRYYPKMMKVWERTNAGGPRHILAKRFNIDRLKGKNILDLGCGTGDIIAKLGIANSNKVYGVDISREFIDKAKKRGIIAKYCDIEKAGNLPFPTDYFDVIFMFDLIEHIFYPKSLFKKVTRTLKRGGMILATLPNWENKEKKKFIQEVYEKTLKTAYGKRIPEGAKRYADFNFITIGEMKKILPKDIKIKEIHGFKWKWNELSSMEKRDLWENPKKARDLFIVMKKHPM